MRKIILAAVFSLFAWPALAVTCPVTTLQVKDNGNVTANMATGDDGSGAGNCEAAVQLKQGGNTATVTTHGLSVDGSGVTQPISAASLPLPTGAATSANQATVTTWAGGTLGAMSNYGTSPGAVLVPGINANVTNTINAAQAGTWNINNISGTISLPTGAATAANQATAAAQASTTSGQTGPLVQCAVTTSAPSYTTAQTDPISCDTSGLARVRIDGGSAVNSNGSATAANSSPVVVAQTTAQVLNALTNTKTQVKGSAGQLVMLQCGNTNASEVYVQVFNQASSAVTVGSTAPTLSIPIAATSTGGFALPGGIQMNGATPGITVAATTTATGSTAPGSALDCNAAYQ